MPAQSKIEHVPLTPQLKLVGALSSRLLAILYPADGLFMPSQEMDNVGTITMQACKMNGQDGFAIRVTTVTEALKKSIASTETPV